MNSYIAPWHIFVHYEGAAQINISIATPEIYYS